MPRFTGHPLQVAMALATARGSKQARFGAATHEMCENCKDHGRKPDSRSLSKALPRKEATGGLSLSVPGPAAL